LSYREIESAIQLIEQNGSLGKEENFAARAEALDFIEFHVVDRIEGLLLNDRGKDLETLRQRAESLKNRLEKVNEKLFQRLRATIRAGCYTCEDLRRQFYNYAGCASEENEIGYDALDIFVNDLLRIDLALEETREKEPDMVFLQPTPARIVLELVEKVDLTEEDIFYDLGSGLGQVAILVGLFSGARTKGIEFEPAYCAYAQRCAARLNLSRVQFMNLDARDADYSDGTVFFMYTPFRGSMLQEVLERLRSESRKRAITICTYGPCTPRVSDQDWLRCIGQLPDHEYELAVFRSG
jgi:tRNA/tmRNA/rRNA uracil-C5-methylase (TrmA/RlmC/RlmD family)